MWKNLNKKPFIQHSEVRGVLG